MGLMHQVKLSKTDFTKGKQCTKALWLNYYEPDLKPDLDDKTKNILETGEEINELARSYFKDGISTTIDDYFDILKASEFTKELISQNHQIIFEATAIESYDNSHARIDILQKNEDGTIWNLIEVKGSTKAEKYHIDDLAFQYHIFTKAGFKIDKCLLMLINSEYRLKGEINPQEFFKFEDITDQVLEKQNEVEAKKQELIKILNNQNQPNITIGDKCFKPFDCEYHKHCWQNIPDYSIFNVCHRKTTAERIADEINSYEVNNIDVSNYEKGIKELDIICYQENKTHLDKEKLSEFLSTLKYPLYFLDYESFSLAIPILQNTRPYQQIPFQFSLHIQEKPDQELSHFEFLHQEKSDPRKDFIHSLVNNCGDNGSIIVYYEPFEKSRNKELAKDFSEYSKPLLNLNERIIDLMVPFKKKYIYSPKQESSNSIKKVLPAFTDLSYQNLEIKSGGDAMDIYADFIKGKINLDQKLTKNLLEYCKLDTYAMVKLLKVAQNLSQ